MNAGVSQTRYGCAAYFIFTGGRFGTLNSYWSFQWRVMWAGGQDSVFQTLFPDKSGTISPLSDGWNLSGKPEPRIWNRLHVVADTSNRGTREHRTITQQFCLLILFSQRSNCLATWDSNTMSSVLIAERLLFYCIQPVVHWRFVALSNPNTT